MPVIAVAAAVEGGMALAAGGLTAFETISAVGAIVGGVGALTGNQTMMKIGGVAALAGGMGAFAQGKGWIASDGALGDAGSNIDTMKNTQAPTSDANPTDARLADGTQTTPMDGGSAAQAIGGAPQGGTTGLMNATAPVADTTAASSVLNADSNAKDALLARGDVTSLLAPKKSVLDYFKDFGDWADSHKTLASIGANFVGGMFDKEKAAKTDYYQAQADFTKQETQNMQSAPNMNFRSSGSVGFPKSAPTYQPVKIGGLYAARGG